MLTIFSRPASVRDKELLPCPLEESELYALGALSAVLVFTQAVQTDFLVHAIADSSTARAVATKQGACSFKIWYFGNC